VVVVVACLVINKLNLKQEASLVTLAVAPPPQKKNIKKVPLLVVVEAYLVISRPKQHQEVSLEIVVTE